MSFIARHGTQSQPMMFNERVASFGRGLASIGRRLSERLLLSFLALLPAFDARADEPEVRDLTPANEIPILLSPVVTSALRVSRNPWRYASVPGFEILTRASDEMTEWYLNGLQRGKYIEDHLLPPEWLPALSVPYILIFDDTDLSAIRVSEVHTKPFKFQPPVDALSWGAYARSIQLSMDGYHGGDHDTYATNRNLFGQADTGASIGTVSIERLGRCTPPLPAWLATGLLCLRGGIFHEPFAYSAPGDSIQPAGGGSTAANLPSPIGAGSLWIPIEETQSLLKEIARNKRQSQSQPTLVKMLPLEQLFAEKPPGGDGLALWQSEASLFVRWALFGPRHKQPGFAAAFVRFVEQAQGEPVTEALFVQSFGTSYQEMTRELNDFLVATLAREVRPNLTLPTSFPLPTYTPATSDQIGRLLGDWLRMHARSIQPSDPDLSRNEFYAADRVLMRAYRDDNGLPPDVDPNARDTSKSGRTEGVVTMMSPLTVSATRLHDAELVAVFGLNKHEIGDDVAAREFLERSAKLGTKRPAAYRLLAQLRLEEAKSKPAGKMASSAPNRRRKLSAYSGWG